MILVICWPLSCATASPPLVLPAPGCAPIRRRTRSEEVVESPKTQGLIAVSKMESSLSSLRSKASASKFGISPVQFSGHRLLCRNVVPRDRVDFFADSAHRDDGGVLGTTSGDLRNVQSGESVCRLPHDVVDRNGIVGNWPLEIDPFGHLGQRFGEKLRPVSVHLPRQNAMTVTDFHRVDLTGVNGADDRGARQ